MKSDDIIALEPTSGSQLLPPELWVNIFQRVPCQPITLVCRTFRSLAQPLLFENLGIDLVEEDRPTTNPEWLEFISSPHIAPAVKTCRMYSWTAESEFKQIGLNTLSRFSGLVFLRLYNFTITTSLLDTIASFRRLSELDLLQCRPGVDDAVSPKHPIPLRYLKSGGMLYDALDNTAATLVHPLHTHVLVLEHKPYKFLQRLLDTGSSLALRSLTLHLWMAASPQFPGIMEICPALEELRFEDSFSDSGSSRAPPCAFNKPPKNALSHLQAFQGPWYMVEAFIKERPVTHLIIRDFDEGKESAIQTLVTHGLRYPVESLELHLQSFTSTLARALSGMNVIRALSLVITSENWKVCTSPALSDVT